MLVYLLKFSACLAIFLVFYKLFLERESMHHLKRYFLLAALILALGIPLITFTQYVEPIIANTASPSFDNFDNFSEITTAPIEVDYTPLILWTIYGLGVLLFGIKFLWNLSNIYYKIQHNPKQKSQTFIHVLLNDLVIPHTFFSYILLNRQKFETKEIPQEVFWHEQAHAKQKHSLDVLFIELLQVVFWFNPLIYLAKHAIKLNHEFLADQAVLKQGVQPSAYQQILLAFSSPDNYRDATEPQLANAINYSSTRQAVGMIKKRFTVMKTHTSKQKIWLRSLLLLPLVAVTLYGFSETQIIEKENPIETALLDAIDLYLNEKGEFLHNEKVITLQEIKELYKQNSESYISITAYPNVDFEIVKNTVQQVKEIGFKKMTYCTSGDTVVPSTDETRKEMIEYLLKAKNQQNATPEEIAEYNKLAKHYNSQEPEKTIIKQKDAERMNYLYEKMSKEQKTNAEPLPKMIPPPPPPPSPPHTEDSAPHPDNSPSSAILSDKELHESVKRSFVYQEAEKQVPFFLDGNKNSSKQAIEFVKKTDNFKIEQKGNEAVYLIKTEGQTNSKGTPPPSTPPAPKSPLDHVIEMAKRGAIFYYEGKSISSDEAIELLKKNEELNISTKQFDSNEPKVYISSESIVIKPQAKTKEMVMLNGKKSIDGNFTLTKEELNNLDLTIDKGKIIDFKFKIPGKPKVSVKGNKLDEEAKSLLKYLFSGDAVQLFIIKNSDNAEHPSILIQIK